jgi:hypothetical protein
MPRKPRATAEVHPKARKTKAGTKGTIQQKPKPKVTKQGDWLVIESEGMAAEDVIEAFKDAKKSSPDWEIIEGQFRAGIISNVKIATLHNISEGAIRKKAKAEGWKRNRADKIVRAAKEKLVRDAGTNESTNRTNKEAEQQAVQTIVSVVRDHQKLLKRGHSLVAGMLAELQETAENRDEIDKAIEDDEGDAKHKAMLRRAVALPQRAGIMLNLSATMKNIVALERQAFSIDDAPAEESPMSALFEMIDGTRWSASAS